MPLTWDIFCRVIDNHGDVGVCWRLCADLATRGHPTRLWIDQADALAWMAPSGHPGVEVRAWDDAQRIDAVGDVVVEAFGCELPDPVQQQLARQPRTVWLNLEYLSAEAHVARQHGLPSPVMSGPAKGLTKWFFFPGFETGTGGLLREPDLLARQQRFDSDAWLTQLGVAPRANAQRVSLFCYEPAALPHWLQQLAVAPTPTELLVTPGRASQAVAQALSVLNWSSRGQGALQLHALPYLSQPDYDHLLWACDLNCVRGEDSLVRALWAGKPLLWHIYPQDDDAHHAKLDAFAPTLQMPETLRAWHRAWNSVSTHLPEWPDAPTRQSWQAWSLNARAALMAQTDLVSQLLRFVAQKR